MAPNDISYTAELSEEEYGGDIARGRTHYFTFSWRVRE
jgi:hypothetical protein